MESLLETLQQQRKHQGNIAGLLEKLEAELHAEGAVTDRAIALLGGSEPNGSTQTTRGNKIPKTRAAGAAA
jgi:hypothetical protein